ncbi:UNVERIFIED_CONTAM: hypothetical protein NCL1_21408 [Trichonephila clavipes]
MVLKAKPTTSVLLAPCHDEFRGPRSDYVRQVTLATTITKRWIEILILYLSALILLSEDVCSNMSLVVTVMLMGLVSALPNELSAALVNKPDTSLPQNTMMGQTLKDLDIEICPDNVHLCPGTAECCKGENGKYDCCPKASVPIAGRGTVATNWDLFGLAVPLLYLNAIGGDAGGHKYITHGS